MKGVDLFFLKQTKYGRNAQQNSNFIINLHIFNILTLSGRQFKTPFKLRIQGAKFEGCRPLSVNIIK